MLKYHISTSFEEIEKFCARTKRFVNLRMLDIFVDNLTLSANVRVVSKSVIFTEN